MKIYINGIPGATLKQTDDGQEFTYLDGYLQLADAVPLSLALPLDHEPYSNRSILPVLQSLELDYNDKPYSSLGSVALAPEQICSFTDLDINDCETKIKSQLLAVPANKLLSIANYQPCLKATIIDGEFYEASPTEDNTHTLKCDLYDFEDLVGNEIFVSLLAYNLGIPVPMISRIILGDIPALIIDRPDRLAPELTTDKIQKIHHETFVTALSTQFSSSKRHYATLPENLFELIRTHALNPALDSRTLLRCITLCLLTGCDDFSLENQLIELKPENNCRLSVLSGFVCSDIYENTTKNLLDYLFGIHHFASLKQAHVSDLARRIQVNDKYLINMILEYCVSLPKITREIFDAYPTIKSSVTLKIAKLIESRCSHLIKVLDKNEKSSKPRKIAVGE